MNSITFLKALDTVVGKGIMALLPRTSSSPPVDMKRTSRVLFIRPGGIGDFLLLLPTINAMASGFPHIRIDVLCEKRNSGVAAFTSNFNNVYLYDRGVDLVKCLKKRYDIVIDTEQWHRLSAVTAYLTGAPLRIGFTTNERGKVFTHRIHYDENTYETLCFSRLIEPLLGQTPNSSASGPFVKSPDSLPPRLTSMLKRSPIAVAPGASAKEKLFPPEKFARIVSEFADKGHSVILLGSSKDKVTTGTISRLSPGCIDLAGETSLAETASILKLSRLLLTTDSALLHLAVGLGIPTVALFGCSNEKKWAPENKNCTVISKNLDCAPCSHFGNIPECARNIECLTTISCEEIIRAVKNTLKINILLTPGVCRDRKE